MGAPRLVEYWEQDPCNPYPPEPETKMMRFASSSPKKSVAKSPDDLGVTIEAQFVVGEYQIVILSAKDSTGLDTWLKQEKYKIPDGAEPLLRPYVESGMKFFVAKVDPKKVKFVDGRAELSPLRFHYDTDRFELPIRLGLANSSGTQDLIVNILAPNQRYEVANYKNVTIPTNIDVKDSVRNNFGAFYAALFDRTIEKHPGAVITEYAWQATTCDPCPGPALNYNDFQTLGADVLEGGTPEPQRPVPRGKRPIMRGGGGSNFVLTRLHARYGKDIKDDLQFVAAAPIVGGREFVVDETTHKLEEGAKPADVNNFQGRYAIRHEWTGAIACQDPKRGIWGGPPGGGRPQTKAGLDLAFAPRGEVQLATAIVPRDVPEIGMTGGVLEVYAQPQATALPPPTTPPPVSKGERGCGCQTSDPAGLLGVLGALLIFRSRSRRRRLKGA
jgi:MYXO-CTERM domain-containing protein